MFAHCLTCSIVLVIPEDCRKLIVYLANERAGNLGSLNDTVLIETDGELWATSHQPLRRIETLIAK